jgi:hypothetical protein
VGRNGIPLAAILMPAGSSSLRCTEGRLSRDRFVGLLYAGAVSLGAGAVALGIGLLTSG